MWSTVGHIPRLLCPAIGAGQLDPAMPQRVNKSHPLHSSLPPHLFRPHPFVQVPNGTARQTDPTVLPLQMHNATGRALLARVPAVPLWSLPTLQQRKAPLTVRIAPQRSHVAAHAHWAASARRIVSVVAAASVSGRCPSDGATAVVPATPPRPSPSGHTPRHHRALAPVDFAGESHRV